MLRAALASVAGVDDTPIEPGAVEAASVLAVRTSSSNPGGSKPAEGVTLRLAYP